MATRRRVRVAAYPANGDADATGIDISPAMVTEAGRRFPGQTFEVGDLRRLSRPDMAGEAGGCWGVVLADPSRGLRGRADAVGTLVRPLAPGGWLVLEPHAWAEVRHLDEWFGHRVDLA